jgi:transcriptional regulator with XRE-family HTH domain
MKPIPSPASLLLGERLRHARVELGLSQEAIAELASMHVTNYGKIERGRANPSLVTMIRIAAVIGVDVSTLTADMGVGHLPDEIAVVPASEFLIERARHVE